MTTKESKQSDTASQCEEPDMHEIVRCVSEFTRKLLSDGANPSNVAFALTTVATDMGLQVTGDPLRVIPVLMDAIAFQAKRRVDESQENVAVSDEGCDIDLPSKGTTIH